MASKMGSMTTSPSIVGDKNSQVYDRTDVRAKSDADENIDVMSGDIKIDDNNEVAAQTQIRNKESRDDEFLVKYHGKNYEIRDLLKKHPGGSRTLGAFRGLSLDKVLNDVPHSDAAFHLFEEFVVDKHKEYDDIENLVNWNEPLLGQVGNLADRYWEWVNLPVNRSIRLFQSNFLEYLTITPWYIVPTVWIPIIMYFLSMGIIANNSKNNGKSIATIPLAVCSGILLWTFIEYVLHRKIFHLKPRPESKILITLHFILHGLHHKAPFDDRRLVFPPAAAIVIAMVFYNLFGAVLPDVIIDLVAAGTMTGYLCYDLMHYYLHHGNPKADSYLYVMKRYHNHHHFSHHNEGFGISSRLWDFVFGSSIRLKKLKKSIVW